MISATRASLALLAAGFLAARDAQAQREDSALAARMRGFTHAVADGRLDEVAAFFPREGDWMWVHAATGGRGRRVARWRFPGSDARRAIDEGGPLCSSFHNLFHAAPVGDWLIDAAQREDPWRYAGGGRYVPTGVFAGAPVFVQWRREGARWVVSALGDHGVRADESPAPRLLGYPVGLMIRRDTLLPPPDPPVDATALDWYRRGAIRYEGIYERYGVPRPLKADSIRRYGVIGRVPLYRAWSDRGDPPEVLYVLTGPDHTYQPFVDWSASEPCNRSR